MSLEAHFIKSDTEFGELPDGIDYEAILDRAQRLVGSKGAYIKSGVLAPFSDDLPHFLVLKVWSKITEFDGRSNFWTWFHRVALNTLYDVCMFLGRRPSDSLRENGEVDHSTAFDLQVGGEEDVPAEDRYDDCMASLELDNAISKLPKPLQEVIRMSEADLNSVRKKARIEAGRRLKALLKNPYAELIRNRVVSKCAFSELRKVILRYADMGLGQTTVARELDLPIGTVGRETQELRNDLRVRLVLAERAFDSLGSHYENLLGQSDRKSIPAVKRLNLLIDTYISAFELLPRDEQILLSSYYEALEKEEDIQGLCAQFGISELGLSNLVQHISQKLDDCVRSYPTCMTILSRMDESTASFLKSSLNGSDPKVVAGQLDISPRCLKQQMSLARESYRVINARLPLVVPKLGFNRRRVFEAHLENRTESECAQHLGGNWTADEVGKAISKARGQLLCYSQHYFAFVLDLLTEEDRMFWRSYETGSSVFTLAKKYALTFDEVVFRVEQIARIISDFLLGLDHVAKDFLSPDLSDAFSGFLKTGTWEEEESSELVRNSFRRIFYYLPLSSEILLPHEFSVSEQYYAGQKSSVIADSVGLTERQVIELQRNTKNKISALLFRAVPLVERLISESNSEEVYCFPMKRNASQQLFREHLLLLPAIRDCVSQPYRKFFELYLLGRPIEELAQKLESKNPEEALEIVSQQVSCIVQSLGSLKEDLSSAQRECFELCCQGLTPGEIAQQTNRATNTVKVQLVRARNKIRRHVEACFPVL